MPAKVQTKARANRVKLFKTFYQTSKPRFRCYHGGRLPPKTFEGLWKHKKFYTKDIKVGHTAKPSKKITLLDKKQTARPQARGKRGPLRATVVGKKKPVIKALKRKKTVTWSKVKEFAQEREQVALPAAAMHIGRLADMAGHRLQVGGDPYGDPFEFEGPAVRRQFRRDAAGNLVPFAPKAARVRVV